MSIAAVEGNEIPFFDQPRDLRRAIREGDFEHYTVGQVPGYVHTNICILPLDYAYEFQTFCQRNPRPCPLLAMSAPGDPALPELGEDIDIRTDVPQYRIFRDGQFVEDVSDIRQLWRDDMVTFAMGCSLSFEEALIEGGLPLRHFDNRENVPIYLTDIDCKPAGRFAGKLVVSMRPFSPADAIRAIQITTRFPGVHGAPVHIGDPSSIGIDDLSRSEWITGASPLPGEVPVFWACGVTPQMAALESRPELMITHYPSHMFISDVPAEQQAVL
jgi:uncharacterized protein YcsI (UPF0317 family)